MHVGLLMIFLQIDVLVITLYMLSKILVRHFLMFIYSVLDLFLCQTLTDSECEKSICR